MSIIDCSQCGKKISSLAPICDHCGNPGGKYVGGKNGGGKPSSEDLQRYRERSIRDRLYRLGMLSYASMTIVILAFAWYWVATSSFQTPPGNNGPYYLMMVGALAYLVVRIQIFRARAQRRSIRS